MPIIQEFDKNWILNAELLGRRVVQNQGCLHRNGLSFLIAKRIGPPVALLSR